MEPDPQDDPAPPAAYYLVLAGVPAGLLLWLGCAYVLRHAGATPEEAGGTLLMIKILSWLGLAVTTACILYIAKALITRRLP